MSTNLTVIGPDPSPNPTLAPKTPATFDSQGDFQEYCTDVSRWEETIQATAKRGKDKMSKIVYDTLGHQLYDSVLSREQERDDDEA